MKYSFIKEENSWYIDLPAYIEAGGSKGSLAMVAGADTFLDILLNNNPSNKVTLDLETEFQNEDGFEVLDLIPPSNKVWGIILDYTIGGADYILKEYKGREINHKMWLCDVTKYVFGYFPQRIHFKQI